MKYGQIVENCGWLRHLCKGGAAGAVSENKTALEQVFNGAIDKEPNLSSNLMGEDQVQP